MVEDMQAIYNLIELKQSIASVFHKIKHFNMNAQKNIIKDGSYVKKIEGVNDIF